MTPETTIRAALERAGEFSFFDSMVADALTALDRLVAERDAAEAKGWNEALEAAANYIADRVVPPQPATYNFSVGKNTGFYEAQYVVRALRKDPQG